MAGVGESDVGKSAGRMEVMAVALSFWFGGVGLASMKGVAYFASGSTLVRAAMFESLGDVVSSAIMAITQRQVNDSSNQHRYPLGKSRFAPLGVLFFSAFMCSAMLSMAIESMSELFASSSADENAGGEALRRLFEEEPHLRKAAGPDGVDRLVKAYGGGEDGDETPVDNISTYLMFVCFVVKFALLLFCRHVQSFRGSEIVKALGDDHRNDSISTILVLIVMYFVIKASDGDSPPWWLGKVDPVASLVLALWILYGWGANALEQLSVLSDQRTEDDSVEKIGQAAQSALRGTTLQIHGLDVYHAGEALRVRIDLKPAPGDKDSENLAKALGDLEEAVRAANDEVVEVDTQLRPPSFSSRNKESFSWVGEYAGM